MAICESEETRIGIEQIVLSQAMNHQSMTDPSLGHRKHMAKASRAFPSPIHGR